jgi:hypothetical protein
MFFFSSQISLAKEDLKRTTEQCKELTEALEQQQQQITNMQVLTVCHRVVLLPLNPIAITLMQVT